jgi:phosphotransferase system enzyme I (PtsI)
MVNIESIRDLDTFDPAHTDGVGLLRTEFLYMERTQFPSEEEQYRLYRRVVERMGGRTVTLRTLDIGNDKQLSYFKTPKENNPALGWRGLRISVEWQDLLRVQLRAALRASAHGPMRILLPMVTSIEEVREVHKVFDGVRRQLADQGFEIPADVPVGIMVEVPSAVLVLHHLVQEVHRIFDRVRTQLQQQGYEIASDVPVGIMVEVPSTVFVIESLLPEVDFVSVGTNDLVQYMLAVDRDNTLVSKLYEPAHPAVTRALALVAEAARAAGRSCSVCGEMAGEDSTALMLLGMGYDSVSVAPNLVPENKPAVRHSSWRDARELARLAGLETTSSGVRGVLEDAKQRLHGRQMQGLVGPDSEKGEAR